MDYIERYEAFLRESNINFLSVGDMLFREYNQIIIPLGPIIRQKPEVKIIPKAVFKQLKGKLLWWSYYNENNKNKGWYGVVKDKHLEIEEYPSSNIRNQVRKGLKSCEIKSIDVDLLVKEGYGIYEKVFESYRQNTISRADFQKQMAVTKNFDDIIEYRGIFIDKELIGYAVIYCYGNKEANISEVRIRSEYNKLYPSYALFHKLSEEYLKERGFAYLSDGYRNLMHASNIQEMLIKKFGFKKVYLQLDVSFRTPYGLLIGLYPIRKIVSHFSPSLKAVFKLLEATKN